MREGRSLRTMVVVALAAAAMLGAVVVARAAWVNRNCSPGGGYKMLGWKRSQATAYFQPMNHEGYEWGGGCFKLNDRDDTPGAPDSGGEGSDCSGLVFRTWALKNDRSMGYHYWDYAANVHGPYTTASYHDPARSQPFTTIPKGYGVTLPMDAFVYRTPDNTAGHIGLIYQEGSGGVDYVAESAGDAGGTWIQLRDYRSQSAYRGVRRKGWLPDCFPKCGV